MEQPQSSGIVTLTTDFGLVDHYAGVMRGVIFSICPAATVVDLTHGVEPQQIEQGAFFLAQGYAAFPGGSVHVAVVDPAVGTKRRYLVAIAHGHYFVGPDNGVLSHVLAGANAKVLAVDVERILPPLESRTFHGRDVFAPLGARIAIGESISNWGERIADYARLPSLEPEALGSGCWRGRVLSIDRFGNFVTSLRPELIKSFEAGFVLRVGQAEITRQVGAYDEVDDKKPFVITGSAGFLEISVRQGSAVDAIEAALGDAVELRDDSVS